MRVSEIAKAIKDMTKAAHERISGHRFLRRSISQRQSQCGAVPGRHPEACCASSVFDLERNSSSYPGGTLGVSVLTDANLAAIEKKARAYYESFSRGGIVSDYHMRTDLTDEAYLASVGCLDLLAEIRRLQALVARKGAAPDVS